MEHKSQDQTENELMRHIEEILHKLDVSSTPFKEWDLAEAINKILAEVQEADDEDRFAATAEGMAFSFQENYQDERTGWGTYYGPMVVLRNEGGQWIESPSIRLVTERMIEYWWDRANTTSNPALRSRYADLVWDFSKPVVGKGASIQMAHTAIDAYQQLVKEELYAHEVQAITKLQRSLSLALSIGDEERIKSVRDTMINFEDKIARDDKSGMWGFCFDSLLENKKIPLAPEQRQKLIGDMEARLIRTSTNRHDDIALFATEAAAIRLARYYRRANQLDKAHHALRVYGQAVLTETESVKPLMGSAWVHKLYEIYYEYGLRGEADALSSRLEDLGRRTEDEMHTISHQVEIPSERLEEFLLSITDGTLPEVLTRVAWQFLPDAGRIAKQVRELAEAAPLEARIPRTLRDREGRILAQVGSLEDDLDGRIVLQMSQNMQIEAFFLRKVVESTLLKFSPQTDAIVGYLYQSPVFRPDNSAIITEGISAYLSGNYLATIHLLIPQIEQALRELMRLTESPIYRPARNGGLFLRNLEEILRDEGVIRSLGETIVQYLRILLIDQRGWNVRNDICHGIAHPGKLGPAVADRLYHVLLLLGQIR